MTKITTITKPTVDALGEREETDYRAFKERFLRWLETMGKDPSRAEGYAHETIAQTSLRTDRFLRWLWSDAGYTTAPDAGDATEYMRALVMSDEDYSNNHLSNEQKAIKRLFKWLNADRGRDVEWEPDISFSSQAGVNPRDFLTREERTEIRNAALEYGSVPAYTGLDAEEREEWKDALSQRFGKPKVDISKADFERANGWKIPSLVWTSLDTGLRPIEVERSRIGWVDVDNRVLRIPAGESSKNEDNWVVSLTDRTAEALERWITERELYDRYDGSDAIWLTREANPYSSNSLSYLLKSLFDVADIGRSEREVSWYMIRHSVGTYMAREEGLAAAKAQLRHQSETTTMKYDQTPTEDRRDALGRMG